MHLWLLRLLFLCATLDSLRRGACRALCVYPQFWLDKEQARCPSWRFPYRRIWPALSFGLAAAYAILYSRSTQNQPISAILLLTRPCCQLAVV